MNFVREDMSELRDVADPFAFVDALDGEVFRAVATRRTLRVMLGDRAYFLKRHWGVGWREIFKNWVTLKRPVLGARNEYVACRHLEAAGVPAPRVAAFAERGLSPAARDSFVLCDALEPFESLEDITARWLTDGVTWRERQRVLRAVAAFTAKLHQAGVVHRDFYICHLLAHSERYASGEVVLAVIDLHRALLFDAMPRNWRQKDLGALLFSTLDLSLSQRDWLRFIRIYTGRPLREELADNGAFWDGVLRRAEKLYRKGLSRNLVAGYYKP